MPRERFSNDGRNSQILALPRYDATERSSTTRKSDVMQLNDHENPPATVEGFASIQRNSTIVKVPATSKGRHASATPSATRQTTRVQQLERPSFGRWGLEIWIDSDLPVPFSTVPTLRIQFLDGADLGIRSVMVWPLNLIYGTQQGAGGMPLGWNLLLVNGGVGGGPKRETELRKGVGDVAEGEKWGSRSVLERTNGSGRWAVFTIRRKVSWQWSDRLSMEIG